MRTVLLKDVARFIRGVTFKPTDISGLGVGVMRTKNVQASLDLDDIIRISPTLVKRDDQYLRPGDTLVSSANSWAAVGKACWVPEMPEPLAIGGFVTALRPAPDLVDPRFLYLWFTTPRTQSTLRSMSNQTTNISNLNLSRAENLRIPLPPMDEQRRIAAILDRADALRAKRRQVLNHLDALTRAIFDGMFSCGGFDVVAARRLMPSMRNGLSPATAGTHSAQVLTLSAVTHGVFDPTAVKAGLFAIEPPMDKRVSARDFLMCRGNGNRALVGVGTYSGTDRPDLVFPDTVIAGTVDLSLVTMPYLNAAWQRSEVRSQIESVARTTNGTFKVNQQTVAEISISLPPLDLQRTFDARVERIGRLRATVQRTASTDEQLFASLQSRAFRGGL